MDRAHEDDAACALAASLGFSNSVHSVQVTGNSFLFDHPRQLVLT